MYTVNELHMILLQSAVFSIDEESLGNGAMMKTVMLNAMMGINTAVMMMMIVARI